MAAKNPYNLPPPEVSVIVVSFNQCAKTVDCFKSIRANCPLSREIIWVDNGSEDDQFTMMRRAATRPRMRTKLIRFEHNTGFVHGVNSGLKEIDKRSKYIILLNNDTIVGPKSFTKMVKPLADRKVGAVGCVTQSRISWQRSTWLNQRWPELKVPDYTGDVDEYTRLLEKKFPGKYIDVESNNLSFFAVAFRKDVFSNVLMGLEEDFGIGLADDDYACHKLRFLGYKLYLALDAFIFHHHRTTFTAINMNVDALRRQNVKTLKKKIKELEKTKQ